MHSSSRSYSSSLDELTHLIQFFCAKSLVPEERVPSFVDSVLQDVQRLKDSDRSQDDNATSSHLVVIQALRSLTQLLVETGFPPVSIETMWERCHISPREFISYFSRMQSSPLFAMGRWFLTTFSLFSSYRSSALTLFAAHELFLLDNDEGCSLEDSDEFQLAWNLFIASRLLLRPEPFEDVVSALRLLHLCEYFVYTHAHPDRVKSPVVLQSIFRQDNIRNTALVLHLGVFFEESHQNTETVSEILPLYRDLLLQISKWISEGKLQGSSITTSIESISDDQLLDSNFAPFSRDFVHTNVHLSNALRLSSVLAGKCWLEPFSSKFLSSLFFSSAGQGRETDSVMSPPSNSKSPATRSYPSSSSSDRVHLHSIPHRPPVPLTPISRLDAAVSMFEEYVSIFQSTTLPSLQRVLSEFSNDAFLKLESVFEDIVKYISFPNCSQTTSERRILYIKAIFFICIEKLIKQEERIAEKTLSTVISKLIDTRNHAAAASFVILAAELVLAAYQVDRLQYPFLLHAVKLNVWEFWRFINHFRHFLGLRVLDVYHSGNRAYDFYIYILRVQERCLSADCWHADSPIFLATLTEKFVDEATKEVFETVCSGSSGQPLHSPSTRNRSPLPMRSPIPAHAGMMSPVPYRKNKQSKKRSIRSPALTFSRPSSSSPPCRDGTSDAPFSTEPSSLNLTVPIHLHRKSLHLSLDDSVTAEGSLSGDSTPLESPIHTGSIAPPNTPVLPVVRSRGADVPLRSFFAQAETVSSTEGSKPACMSSSSSSTLVSSSPSCSTASSSQNTEESILSDQEPRAPFDFGKRSPEEIFVLHCIHGAACKLVKLGNPLGLNKKEDVICSIRREHMKIILRVLGRLMLFQRHVFQNRDLNQILLCIIYAIVCRLYGKEYSDPELADIVILYTSKHSLSNQIYRKVLMNFDSEGSPSFDTIRAFYNDIFLPTARSSIFYVLRDDDPATVPQSISETGTVVSSFSTDSRDRNSVLTPFSEKIAIRHSERVPEDHGLVSSDFTSSSQIHRRLEFSQGDIFPVRMKPSSHAAEEKAAASLVLLRDDSSSSSCDSTEPPLKMAKRT